LREYISAREGFSSHARPRLVTTNDVLKLTDFGEARAAELNMTMTAAGTRSRESVPYYRDWTFMRRITEGYTRGDTSHPRGGRIAL